MKRNKLFLVFLFTVVASTSNALTIIREAGWFETAYITWQPTENAKSYNVYYSGAGMTDQKIDNPLIRSYGDYFRADVLGLKAGKYTLTIKAVNDEATEFDSVTSSEITVKPHLREGFAFANGIVPGAYNEDGTAKDGARIIYITAATANTVTCDVNNNKGVATSYTGLGNILDAYGKGYDQTPLIVRMIGLIKNTQIDGLKDGNFISFTGSNSTTRKVSNITFEGVGDDATAYGYGFCMKRALGIEIRNVGIMLFGDDAISMDTDNSNIWIHNNDFFYGAPGSDADQVKGDGTIDMKYNSSNISISYNHFWDSGKAMGCGGSTETVPTFYVTFNHNWFDHADSRCPRLHYATAHVYNNYFDGIAKYCIGNTTETSVFVEANHFKNCPRPMMISGQGTDKYDSSTGTYTLKGTFSGQDGGMTKAYHNLMENVDKLVYQTEHPTQFDAYLVAARNEQIPADVKSITGEFAYTNFDTAPEMYSYNPLDPNEVKEAVSTYAGRIDGGDFKWEFSEAENSNSEIIPELKTAIIEYKSALVAIQGVETNDDNEDDGEDDDDPVIDSGIGSGVCELIAQGASSGFTFIGSTSDSKGSVTVNGIAYNCCLKMGSSSSIAFTTTSTMNLSLLFDASENKRIKIEPEIGEQTITGGKVEVADLPAGSYTISRTNGESFLFYISLSSLVTGLDSQKNRTALVYLENEVIRNPGNIRIQVYDATGRFILSGNEDVYISGFARGVYFVRIADNEQVVKVIR